MCRWVPGCSIPGSRLCAEGEDVGGDWRRPQGSTQSVTEIKRGRLCRTLRWHGDFRYRYYRSEVLPLVPVIAAQ